MIRRNLLGLALFALGFLLETSAFGQPVQGEAPVKIGMVRAFFNDLPDAFRTVGEDVFNDVMKAAVGREGRLSTDDYALGVAEKLNTGDLQLGVFHGHEFAWVQKKFPKLVPLMVIHNKHRDVSAYIIVHKNNKAENLGKFSDKTIDVPLGTKEHCLIYLNQKFSDNAQKDWKKFFTKVVRSKSEYEALNDVAAGRTPAVVVDLIALDRYKKERGPVFDLNLRILDQSEQFPPPVIAYKAGGVDSVTLKTVSDGLLNAHNTPAAQDILKMWQIQSFEMVPDNFSQKLAKVLKDFPPPAAVRVDMR